MKPNLKLMLAAGLALLTLGSPSLRAAEPAELEAIVARAEAAKAQAKLQADLDQAQTELEKAEAKLRRADGEVGKALQRAFAHRGGRGEPTVQIGQSIHLKTNETVRELVVVLGDAVVDGTVKGNLVVVLGEARVNGTVEGNAVNVGKGLILGPDAVVGGDAVGVLGGVERAEGAKVGGKVVPVKLGQLGDFTVPRWVQRAFTGCVLKGRPLAFGLGWVWAAAGAFLLGYLVLAAVFPRPVEAIAWTLGERGATSFLMGLAALPFLAFVSLLLVATGIGTLVVPFVWAALLVAVLFGKAGLLRHLGGALGRQLKVESAPLVMMLVGAVVVSLFYVIPYVGLIAWMVLTMWGLGAALLALFAGFSKERAPMAAAPAPGWAQPAFTPSAAPVPAPRPRTTLSVEVPTAAMPPADGGGLGFATAPLASATEPSPRAFPAPDEVPGVPEAFKLVRVGFGRRCWAALLDWMLLFFVVDGPVLHLDHHWDKLKWLLYLAYFIGFHVWKGTTLGGLVLGLKVARLDGRPLDFACALVRALGSVLSGLPALLGWFWCAWDAERQTWHDKLAGTVVVRVEKIAPLV